MFDKNKKRSKEEKEKLDKRYQIFYSNIKEMIRLNIEYHEPKLIVITNAKASHWVEEALKNENENKRRKYNIMM